MIKFIKKLVIFFPLVACSSEPSFIIYYLPLKINLYVPPTAEYIMKYGTNFEIKSNRIHKLFNIVNNSNKFYALGDEEKKIRILIIDNKNKEKIFITQDKDIVSLKYRRVYIIKKSLINNILKDIERIGNKKRDSNL